MKLIKTILCGVPVLFLLIYPVFFGATAYVILRLLDVHHKAGLVLAIGYVLLALLPCWILGDVLLTVKNGSAKREDEALPAEHMEKKDLLEIWKKCVDVQMHFNGIELQIRNYAVTLLVAVIGATAYALKEHLDVKVFDHTFSMAVAILPAGILGWYAFYFMDRHWYHRLLLGSVFHTIKIEKAVGAELQLGVAIGKESPIPILGKQIHSTQKIDLFYAAGLTFLIALTGFVLLQGALFTASPTLSNTPQPTSQTCSGPPASGSQQSAKPPGQPAQPNQEATQTQAPPSK
jgi:hypothetical protein